MCGVLGTAGKMVRESQVGFFEQCVRHDLRELCSTPANDLNRWATGFLKIPFLKKTRGTLEPWTLGPLDYYEDP